MGYSDIILDFNHMRPVSFKKRVLGALN